MITKKEVMRVLENETPDYITAPCAICGERVNAKFYCFGCNHFICEKHPDVETMMRKHDYKEHQGDKNV
jgi:hypothetical protein